MMMAEVGFMLKVSGSRMATPLAPPRPGSTPMSTPRMMPTTMSKKFMGVITVAKPWNSALISSIFLISVIQRRCSVAQEGEWIQGTLVQGNFEPDFEHHEKDGIDRQGDDD